MEASHSRLFSREFLAAAFVAAAGFFVLGYGAILIMPKGNSAAVIWPATAFAACVILRHARGWTQRSVMLAGVAVADLLNNGLGGDRIVMTIGYSLVNVLELAIALVLASSVRRMRTADLRKNALAMLRVCLVPALLGGAGSVLIAWADGQQHLMARGCTGSSPMRWASS